MAFIAGPAVKKHHGHRSDEEIARAATQALVEFTECVRRDRSVEAASKGGMSGQGNEVVEFKLVGDARAVCWKADWPL